MCPRYRVTYDEQHRTRGRANTLRLALSGQMGSDAFTSDELRQTLDLCVSCKGCKRECPTGVDMAKMKIEYLYQWQKRSEEHTSELQSLMRISYAVFCLKKKKHEHSTYTSLVLD